MSSLVSTVYRDFKGLAWPVKMASYSAALFMFGWGFFDSYMSIFFSQIFGGSVATVGYIFGISMFASLVMSLPAMESDQYFSIRRSLILGKLLYIGALIAYFYAAVYMSLFILALAVIIHGIGNPFVHTGYESMVREYSTKKNASRAFGFYSFLTGGGWIAGILITAIWVIPHVDISFLPLIVLFFMLIGIFLDLPLPAKEINWKKSLHTFLSLNKTWKKTYEHLTHYNSKTYFTLIAWFFWSFLDMMTFIFLPLFALSLDLNLTQIGLLTITLRAPYLFSFFFAELADRSDRFYILAGSFLLVSVLLGLLVFTSKTLNLFLIILALATCLAVIRPTISGILTTLVTPQRRIEITGVQYLFVKGGAVVGTVLFGSLAEQSGFHLAYGIFAVMTLAIAAGCMWVRAHFSEHGALEHFKKPVHHKLVR